MSYEDDSQIVCSIPTVLDGKISTSDVYLNYTSRGNPSSYLIDLEFEEMGFHKTVKSTDFNALRGKVEDTIRVWATKYERYLMKQNHEEKSIQVNNLNNEVTIIFDELKNILNHTIDIDDTVSWDKLKREDNFQLTLDQCKTFSKKYDYIDLANKNVPKSFNKIVLPPKPTIEDTNKKFGFFTKLFNKSKIEKKYLELITTYEKNVSEINSKNQQREEGFQECLKEIQELKDKFDNEKKANNDAIENIKNRYHNKENTAIEEHCDIVLNNSKYPDYFPQNWDIEYKEESNIILVDYELPSPELMPTVESYKYVKSKDEITQKKLSNASIKKLYESVIYQICLRTIHEIFESDVINTVEAVCFNGIVNSLNNAIGQTETKVIISVIANKDEFMQINLSQIDPKATFKHLKGIAATSLIDIVPIAPVMEIDKSDKRFVSNQEIVDNLDQSTNLAAIHWEEFEHLVRELFEKEFAINGGEVKVTQASSDGGVDAIAFDPDPIRGGKIVIQAKRYTNVVGVSAVRDLYGTMMNEGATKGVLVTTSDFGKDSYEFAKNKPLSLLNGNNLLSLLEKHGHSARINIQEAKLLLNSEKGQI